MPNQQAANLDLGDIVLTIQLIDTLAKRGAFFGTELAMIGELRGRFATFLDIIKKQSEAPQPTVAPAPAASDAEVCDLAPVAPIESSPATGDGTLAPIVPITGSGDSPSTAV